ncbi:hypothetical protein [Bacillus sp. OK048]|uniref:hypothetical protein n=1 Tax=Bacillus sp. OK048 TaxID=1882761 RepID=UPI0008876D4C|nr:hypothetical protein [Bacillus sp. OK048]SDM17851.1 hypothetical protein SAMN05443253_102186 [Bacillus sp. OK048]
MGLLYNVATIPNLKRNHIIERLLAKGIKETKDGTSIYELSYRELKLQLAIVRCLEIEVESSENGWF